MKTIAPIHVFVTALLFVSTIRATEPDLQFIAVLGSGGEARLALRVATTGRTSWVGVGGTFEGFSVRSFDASSDMVMLTRDGAEYRVYLADSRIQPGKRELEPALRRKILNNLRRLSYAADQFYLENGVATARFDQLVGPEREKSIHAIIPVEGEDYRSIQFEQGKPLEVHTAYGVVVTYDN